jgi:hypothetical protein
MRRKRFLFVEIRMSEGGGQRAETRESQKLEAKDHKSKVAPARQKPQHSGQEPRALQDAQRMRLDNAGNAHRRGAHPEGIR